MPTIIDRAASLHLTLFLSLYCTHLATSLDHSISTGLRYSLPPAQDTEAIPPRGSKPSHHGLFAGVSSTNLEHD